MKTTLTHMNTNKTHWKQNTTQTKTTKRTIIYETKHNNNI